MQIPLLITLHDDVIISARSATSGGHTALDYIPGSLLLGVAASKLYKALADQSTQWTVFHSGKVRFLNGYPISNSGDIAYPMPLNYHVYKNESLSDLPLREHVKRPNCDHIDKTKQLKQVRGNYLTSDANMIKVAKSATMKTAIDSTTGRAAESQLFGYEAISAGQQFLACLEIDQDIDDALAQQITDALTGMARLGRSRSAEYGRVSIEKLSSTSLKPASTLAESDNTISFWCLSELALMDSTTGQPTLTPSASDFGLTKGEFDVKSSYIRSRSYHTFNNHRKAFDSQRQVICQGSIITFKNVNLSAADIDSLERPVGSFIEQGLGQVAVQPQLCVGELIKLAAQKIELPKQAKSTYPTTSPLFAWLEAQQDNKPTDHSNWIDSMTSAMRELFDKARAFNAIITDEPIGPTASQWGAVYQTARDYRHDPSKLIEKLFCGDHAICRERKGSFDTWALEYSPGEYLFQWFAAQLLDTDANKLSVDSKQRNTKADHHEAERKKLNAEQIRTYFKALGQDQQQRLPELIAQLASYMKTDRGQRLSSAKENIEYAH